MELELGLGLPSNGNNYYNNIRKNKKKYAKDQVIVEEEVESKRTTLSLLSWNSDPNDHHKWSTNDDNMQQIDDEEIVGWPPVNSVMKEMTHYSNSNMNYNNNYYYNYNNNNDDDENLNNSVRSSKYVKVKMEGVPIGRKIDLSLYDSYQTLSSALFNMFAKYADADAEYRILYQDKEGDWMLAGDAPWRLFVGSVQRVEMHRNE